MLLCFLLGIITVFVITIIGIITNSIIGKPFGAIDVGGGDCTIYVSFSYTITRFYPLTYHNVVTKQNNYLIEYNFVGIIVSIMIFTTFFWIIGSIIKKIRHYVYK
jgi:hypothetical protein